MGVTLINERFYRLFMELVHELREIKEILKRREENEKKEGSASGENQVPSKDV